MRLGIAAAETPQWPKVDWIEAAAKDLGHAVSRSKDWSQLPRTLGESDLVILAQKSLAGRWVNIRDTLSRRLCPVVYWWFDLLATDSNLGLADQPFFRQFEPYLRHCDAVFVKERGLLPEFQQLGIKAFYLDQGCPADLREIEWADPQFDLLVWGQANQHYRQRLSDAGTAIRRGFKVGWLGGVHAGAQSLPWTAPEQLWKICGQGRCILSCGRRNDLDGYWSDQFWLACGLGACVVRRATPGLPAGPYLQYGNHDELLGHLSWVKNNPDDARQMGRESRKWVMDNHTISNRIRQLLESVPTAKTDIRPS